MWKRRAAAALGRRHRAHPQKNTQPTHGPRRLRLFGARRAAQGSDKAVRAHRAHGAARGAVGTVVRHGMHEECADDAVHCQHNSGACLRQLGRSATPQRGGWWWMEALPDTLRVLRGAVQRDGARLLQRHPHGHRAHAHGVRGRSRGQPRVAALDQRHAEPVRIHGPGTGGRERRVRGRSRRDQRGVLEAARAQDGPAPLPCVRRARAGRVLVL